MGQSATEKPTLAEGREGTVTLTDGTVKTGRFVSFGGWLHGEVTVSFGVEEVEPGVVCRLEGIARRSWPLERVERVVWT